MDCVPRNSVAYLKSFIHSVERTQISSRSASNLLVGNGHRPRVVDGLDLNKLNGSNMQKSGIIKPSVFASITKRLGVTHLTRQYRLSGPCASGLPLFKSRYGCRTLGSCNSILKLRIRRRLGSVGTPLTSRVRKGLVASSRSITEYMAAYDPWLQERWGCEKRRSITHCEYSFLGENCADWTNMPVAVQKLLHDSDGGHISTAHWHR